MEKIAYLKMCLEQIIQKKGQDLFLKAGSEPRMRLGSQIFPLSLKAPNKDDLIALADNLLDSRQKELLSRNQSVDFGFSFHEKACRFRANAFYQQGNLSFVFRLLWKGVPSFEELLLPTILKQVALEKSGIILVGGAVSSGKTTTLSAMIRAMNENVQKHIVTVEDPIEFIHDDQKCLIQQREIGQDAENFSSALKYVVRQSPDVIVIGEMRDAESFSFALSAAEVGRLVVSTVHSRSVPQVFDRILGFFRREGERETILRHFAANLTCIAVQQLLISKDGSVLVPAVEILLGNYTTRQLVQEHKIDKLPQVLRNAHLEGMQTMNQSIFKLWEAQLITHETALAASPWPQELETMMKGIRIGQDTKILGD